MMWYLPVQNWDLKSSQQQFGALTVKFSPNPIRPKTWPIWEILSHIFESSFTACSYGAFYVSGISKLFRYNSDLIFKILLIFEILSYASNSSFSARFIVLTITDKGFKRWFLCKQREKKKKKETNKRLLVDNTHRTQQFPHDLLPSAMTTTPRQRINWSSS